MNNLKKILMGNLKLVEELKTRFQTIDWCAVQKGMTYYANSLPKDIHEESIKLMNRGWFLWFFDGNFSDFSDKICALVDKSDNEQDMYMCNYVKENIVYFESELCKEHARRRHQIEDAFKSHNLGLYYASIPTLLSLAEGIGRDFYNIGIFAKHKKGDPKAGLPVSDDIFDSISGLDVFQEAVLKPLRVNSDVTKTIHNPNDSQNKDFNRHLIMHGNSSSYGNQENSLKAISLAFFIHKSLGHLKQQCA